jgi:hypothetical protein
LFFSFQFFIGLKLNIFSIRGVIFFHLAIRCLGGFARGSGFRVWMGGERPPWVSLVVLALLWGTLP